MASSVNVTFRRSESVVSREVASETLVVPIRGGVGDLDSIFSFNAVGTDVWALMEKDQSLEHMAEWVAERYEVSKDRATADLQQFLDELLKAGLASQSDATMLAHERRGGVHASR